MPSPLPPHAGSRAAAVSDNNPYYIGDDEDEDGGDSAIKTEEEEDQERLIRRRKSYNVERLLALGEANDPIDIDKWAEDEAELERDAEQEIVDSWDLGESEEPEAERSSGQNAFGNAGTGRYNASVDDNSGAPRRASAGRRRVSKAQVRAMRNLPLETGDTQKDSHRNKQGVLIRPGRFVELEQNLGPQCIKFIRVTMIIQRENGHVWVRGIPFARTRKLGGQLIKRLNEVVMIVNVDEDDDRDVEEQAAVEVDPETIIRFRELRLTNSTFPNYRFTTEEWDWAEKNGNGISAKDWICAYGPLVCRWRLTTRYQDGVKRMADKMLEKELSPIPYEESMPQFRVKSDHLRNTWRGSKDDNAVFINLDDENGVRANNIDHVDIENMVDGPVPLPPGHQYTAADTFSGAGGASRGMVRAGVDVKYAIDHWRPACDTYRKNFPNTKLMQDEIFNFVTSADSMEYRTTFLHLSPPCQVWSPAHTRPGRNDADNTATLFACSFLVSKYRPRIFTLEQTFGILRKVFSPFFNSLLQSFTELGYGVRWKVVNLTCYGLSQPRKRLIMIGAGPGEKLPPFPAPTHSVDGSGGLRMVPTAKECLSVLKGVKFEDHNIYAKIREWRDKENKTMPPWNPNKPLPRTITCSGGQNYHWLGRRDFTAREYATLQGFPLEHKFVPPSVKKQIGNAFPSVVVENLYNHLRVELERADGFIPRLVSLPSPAVISVADDDDIVSDGSEEVLLLHEKIEVLEIGHLNLAGESRKRVRRESESSTGKTIDNPTCLDSDEEAAVKPRRDSRQFKRQKRDSQSSTASGENPPRNRRDKTRSHSRMLAWFNTEDLSSSPSAQNIMCDDFGNGGNTYRREDMVNKDARWSLVGSASSPASRTASPAPVPVTPRPVPSGSHFSSMTPSSRDLNLSERFARSLSAVISSNTPVMLVPPEPRRKSAPFDWRVLDDLVQRDIQASNSSLAV